MTSVARSRRLWEFPSAWLIGVLVGTILVVAAVVIAQDSGDTPQGGGDTAFAEAIGVPLPAPVAGDVVDPAVGMVAPTISAQTFDGDRVQLRVDGTGRVLGFFAHWCGHCQAEVPELTAWLNSTELPADVEVVAISTSVDASADNYPPSAWFAREEWPTAVLLDSENNALADAFGLRTFPYWVVVDQAGEVVQRIEGRIGGAELASLIELAGS